MFSQTPAGQPQGSRVHQCSLNIWSLSITFQHLFHWNFVEKQPTTWLKKESSLTRYWKCIEQKLMLRGNWAGIERPLIKCWVYSMFSLAPTSTIAPKYLNLEPDRNHCTSRCLALWIQVNASNHFRGPRDLHQSLRGHQRGIGGKISIWMRCFVPIYVLITLFKQAKRTLKCHSTALTTRWAPLPTQSCCCHPPVPPPRRPRRPPRRRRNLARPSPPPPRSHSKL